LGFLDHRCWVPLPGQRIAFRCIEPHGDVERPLWRWQPVYLLVGARAGVQTSGLFAFVLGLLTWLYLGGQVTVLAAEVNVVRAKRLWPRELF